jgi:hypothetical protein
MCTYSPIWEAAWTPQKLRRSRKQNSHLCRVGSSSLSICPLHLPRCLRISASKPNGVSHFQLPANLLDPISQKPCGLSFLWAGDRQLTGLQHQWACALTVDPRGRTGPAQSVGGRDTHEKKVPSIILLSNCFLLYLCIKFCISIM